MSAQSQAAKLAELANMYAHADWPDLVRARKARGLATANRQLSFRATSAGTVRVLEGLNFGVHIMEADYSTDNVSAYARTIIGWARESLSAELLKGAA